MLHEYQKDTYSSNRHCQVTEQTHEFLWNELCLHWLQTLDFLKACTGNQKHSWALNLVLLSEFLLKSLKVPLTLYHPVGKLSNSILNEK